MKAIVYDEPGGPEVLRVDDVMRPELRPDDLLVAVKAAGVNRADILQRRGAYRETPLSDSNLLGLEIAGDVVDRGSRAKGFAPGDRVMGVVGGGGYAQFARIDWRMAMPIPAGIDYVRAACIPEAFITAHEALLHLGGLESGQTALIHAAASGVGSAAVQLAFRSGATVIATAGSEEKLRLAKELGAARLVNRREQDFVDAAASAADSRGVDLIVDFIGADYLARNLQALKPGGRLVLVGLLSGSSAQISLGTILEKRLRIIGTVMKSRPLDEKCAMTRRFADRWLGAFADGRVRPVFDRSFPLEAAGDAHRFMEENRNIGKIALIV